MTTDQHADPTTHVVLVPGFWLGAWAWQDVVPSLHAAGLAAHPVTLPGLADDAVDRRGLTLADHVAAVRDLVDDLAGDVVLVGHSGGAAVVQSVVDERPDRIARVVYVDAGPTSDGAVLFPDLPDGVVDVPFPSDDELAAQQLSTEGLDADALARLRAQVVPEPAGVMLSRVTLRDERRLAVPATVVCTSLPSTTLVGLIAAGVLPTELPDVADVEYIDLPTGHWPMLSRPEDLGAVLATVAGHARHDSTSCVSRP